MGTGEMRAAHAADMHAAEATAVHPATEAAAVHPAAAEAAATMAAAAETTTPMAAAPTSATPSENGRSDRHRGGHGRRDDAGEKPVVHLNDPPCRRDSLAAPGDQMRKMRPHLQLTNAPDSDAEVRGRCSSLPRPVLTRRGSDRASRPLAAVLSAARRIASARAPPPPEDSCGRGADEVMRAGLRELLSRCMPGASFLAPTSSSSRSVSEMRLRAHVDLQHLDLDDVARLHHLARILDEGFRHRRDVHSPSWCTPISTKAPNAATLVTVPSSTMPGLRSVDLLDALLEHRGLERRARIAAGLFQLAQDVGDGRQAETSRRRSSSASASRNDLAVCRSAP